MSLPKCVPLTGDVRRLLCGLILLCFSTPLLALDELPSQLSLELSHGDDGRSDLFLDLDLSISGPRLLLSTAQSRFDSEFVDYTTRSYLIGLYNNPLQTVNFGAELEQWGVTGDISSTTLRGYVAYNSLDWTLALRPQRRDIVLSTSDLCRLFPRCPDEWQIESYGIRVDGNYYWRAWGFTLGLSAHNYDRDLTPLATSSLVIRLFSPLALELAMGFEDYGVTAGLRYAFRHGLLSVDEYHSVSAIDGVASWLTNVRASIELNRQWYLRLNGGLLRMPELGNDNTLYAGLGLVYSW